MSVDTIDDVTVVDIAFRGAKASGKSLLAKLVSKALNDIGLRASAQTDRKLPGVERHQISVSLSPEDRRRLAIAKSIPAGASTFHRDLAILHDFQNQMEYDEVSLGRMQTTVLSDNGWIEIRHRDDEALIGADAFLALPEGKKEEYRYSLTPLGGLMGNYPLNDAALHMLREMEGNPF